MSRRIHGLTACYLAVCALLPACDDDTQRIIDINPPPIETASGWVLRSPTPSPADLRGVAWITPDRGFAVGVGTILRTTDGGENWDVQRVGSTYLSSVYFSDALHGNAVGSGGVILRTNNGGDTWQGQWRGFVVWFNGVAFGDPYHGMVVGDDGTILRTIDGINWTQLPSPKTVDLHGVAYRDNLNAAVVGLGGTVLVTSDGGNTWMDRSYGYGSLRDVALPAPGVIVAVGPHTILYSTDNGASWVNRGIPGVYYTGVSFSSADIGYTAGPVSDVGQFPATVYRTDDGGDTWDKLPYDHTDGISGVSFTDDNTGVVVSSGGDMLETDDGGDTWRHLNHGRREAFSDVAVLSPAIAVLVGYDGALLRTTNGGYYWEELESHTSDWLQAVSFADPAHGLVVGGKDGTILKTSDAGKTWSTQSGGGTGLWGVHYYDENLAFAVGRGLVMRSTDGGDTWTELDTGHTWNLHDVIVLSPSEVIVVGETLARQGTILRSVDGGDTWNTTYEDNVQSFGAVAFADQLTGIIAGDLGIVMRTDDGGVSWTREQVAGASWLYGAVFAPSGEAWVVGAFGAIYTSADGGATWTAQTNLACSTLQGIDAFDEATLMAVGFSGTILYTATGGADTPQP